MILLPQGETFFGFLFKVHKNGADKLGEGG